MDFRCPSLTFCSKYFFKTFLFSSAGLELGSSVGGLPRLAGELLWDADYRCENPGTGKRRSSGQEAGPVRKERSRQGLELVLEVTPMNDAEALRRQQPQSQARSASLSHVFDAGDLFVKGWFPSAPR